MKKQALSQPTERSKFARGVNRFKLSETTRLVRATLAAGLEVTRVEHDPVSGRVSVITGEPNQTEMSSPDDELERWREKKNAG